jgi:hypothetical protein
MHNYVPKIFVLFLLLCGFAYEGHSEEDKLSVSISLDYHSFNNQLPYIVVTTRSRIERRWHPAEGVEVEVYINDISEETFLGKVKTDSKGKGTVVIPPNVKDMWNSDVQHTFYAVSLESDKYEESDGDVSIVRARLTIDTLNEDGIRSVFVKLEEMISDGWQIPQESDVKIGVKRLAGILNVGDESGIHYTDEEGIAIAEFNAENLPGNENGIITLIAKTEFNDIYGTLIAEIDVPWGKPLEVDNSNFAKRSLWGTRDKTPIWLLFLANGILFLVWGVIVFLVIQLVKIVRLGKS